jgi:hypothetical protein
MTATGFAITHNGTLLVDTVRSSEGEAKSAAVKIAKQPGVGWRDLQARGFDLVEVQITRAPPARPRAARRDLTAPRDTPGWARRQTRETPADEAPIRRRAPAST